MTMKITDAPGFKERFARELKTVTRRRNLPFSSADQREQDLSDALSLPTNLCPLTLRAVVDLTLAENAFIAGGQPTPGDIVAVVWRLHPLYKNASSSERSELRTALLKHLSLRDFQKTVLAVKDFIEKSFEDSDLTPSARGKLPTHSFAATYIDFFAKEYGWSADTILDMPMVALFQLRRAIRTRSESDYTPSSPLDDLRASALDWMNEQRQKKANPNT